MSHRESSATAMPHRRHRRAAPASVACALLTVSDTRRAGTDRSGPWLRGFLERSGHRVVASTIVKDEPRAVRVGLREFARGRKVQAILITGGTGIAPRDRTYEAVAGLLEKRLDGFGELFRALSYREIGAAAMLSRAVAGTWRGILLFVMPGSPSAVRLAARRLIVPELGHAAGLLAPLQRGDAAAPRPGAGRTKRTVRK